MSKYVRMRVHLRGFVENHEKESWGELFRMDGLYLSDEQARKVIMLAIASGYEYDTDIPDSRIRRWLGLPQPRNVDRFRGKTSIFAALKAWAGEDQPLKLDDLHLVGEADRDLEIIFGTLASDQLAEFIKWLFAAQKEPTRTEGGAE